MSRVTRRKDTAGAEGDEDPEATMMGKAAP